MYRLFNLFWQYNLPRWSILFIDTFICAFALSIAFLLRFDFEMPPVDRSRLPYDFAVVLGIRFISFAISKTYKGVVRYTSSRDTVRIFTVILVGSVLVFLLNVICLLYRDFYFIPNSVIIMEALVSMFLMISSRLAVKALYSEIKNPARDKMNVLIYGAGESGVISKR